MKPPWCPAAACAPAPPFSLAPLPLPADESAAPPLDPAFVPVDPWSSQGTFSAPMRVNCRYTTLARTSRSVSSKLQLRTCFSTAKRRVASDDVCFRPTSTAVRSPLSLGFIDRVQQLGVVQHLVSVLHPGLPPPGRFFRKPSLPQHPLLAPPFNHRLSSVSSLPSAFSCCAATAPDSPRPERRPLPKTLSTPPAPGAPLRRAWPAHIKPGS